MIRSSTLESAPVLSEESWVAAGVEVAGEVAEPMLELDAPAVCAPIVDEEDAEVLERALEHTAASTPRRAGGRELVERVGAVGNPKTIDATEHVVERVRWDGGRSRSLSYPCRHTLEFTPHQPPQERTATALERKVRREERRDSLGGAVPAS